MRLLVALTLMVGAFLIPATVAHAAGCPSVAYIAVGGTGNPESRGVPGVPGNAEWLLRVRYPADVTQGDRSRLIAMRVMDRGGRELRARCPGTQIRVRAFSLGASAASRVTDRWISDPRMSRKVDAVFYGDPRRPVSRGSGGIEAAGLPNVPGYTWWGARRVASWIRDVCAVGRDIICDSPSPVFRDPGRASAAVAGYLSGGHTYR